MATKWLLGVVLCLSSLALATEPPATAVMKQAQASAKSTNRNVMVIFHASWCGWCKRLDSFLADPEMGRLMAKQFVIVHLDVQEQPDKSSLENPGGETYMEQLKGKNAGLPFFAVVNPAGKMLANSNKDETKGNIGYPAAPEEIAHFMKMLKTGGKLSDSERSSIEKWLKDHAPKQ
jgi:thiol-disulfide isomerase/thioredoxin